MMLALIRADLRHKAEWYGLPPNSKSLIRMMVSDGSSAQIIYRLMQFFQTHHLKPLAALFYKLNAFVSNATIGRGAQFGPGLIILHSIGLVINTKVRAGSNLVLEHGVTIGAEKEQVPVLGDNVFIGANATLIGGIRIGSNVKIGANTLVLKDLPDGAVAIGVPAQILYIASSIPVEDEKAEVRMRIAG